jgi:hypothetical protein
MTATSSTRASNMILSLARMQGRFSRSFCHAVTADLKSEHAQRTSAPRWRPASNLSSAGASEHSNGLRNQCGVSGGCA